MIVGVDIGGTFTDLVLSVEGRLRIHKLLSTPSHPEAAMLEGLERITPGGIAALTQVAHGSTVATNAILERKGARIALLTTAGFRDVLFIGRQNRPELYARQPRLPEPLLPRERCHDVPERLTHEGEVLRPLDEAALEAVLDALAEQAPEAVAVCLLYSYVDASHEQRIRQSLLDRGGLEDWQIVLSSDVLPEFREYERASTVSLEAYVRPVMARYLTRLEAALPEACALRVMKSDGGVMSATTIQRQTVNTALSGPAAGVMGAFHVARLAGYDHILTLDMGGTSTDVALCPGQPQFAAESHIDALPLRARLLDIETIGAGGGSIARVDAGGALRVGPESAGASPGPIVYGRGGDQVTVSDANAMLGRLDPDHFLGGQMTLALDAAQAALAELGASINREATAAARGVIDVANVNIDRALRRVSIARGHDPRDFTLVAFGGAGPLHACEVAEGLEIPRVLLPRYPGVMCALGLLVADVMVDEAQAVMAQADADVLDSLRGVRDALIERGRADLARENVSEDRMRFDVVLDMRYMGQAYELSVPFGDEAVEAFHAAHEATYGHALRQLPVEIVNIRLSAVGEVDKPALEAEPLDLSAKADAALLGEKPSPLGGTLRLYEREHLPPGASFEGEALVFQLDSTVYIAAGWSARVDGYRNLILERNP